MLINIYIYIYSAIVTVMKSLLSYKSNVSLPYFQSNLLQTLFCFVDCLIYLCFRIHVVEDFYFTVMQLHSLKIV